MIEYSTLGVFFAAGFLLLITPGPAVLYIVTRSVEQGRRAGLVSVMGICTGTLAHVAAAALGISALLVTSARAFDVLRYLGAVYLIVLGIRTLAKRDADLDPAAIARSSLRRIFAHGVRYGSIDRAALRRWIEADRVEAVQLLHHARERGPELVGHLQLEVAAAGFLRELLQPAIGPRAHVLLAIEVVGLQPDRVNHPFLDPGPIEHVTHPHLAVRVVAVREHEDDLPP